MVFGNVPKLHGARRLHGLIGFGILTAAVAAPIGCGDDAFSGCEASRTCPSAKGGDTGSGGEAGGSTDTGGSAGSGSSGRSGSGGADDGGAGGDDGTGGTGGAGDDARPTVEAFTPSNGDANVERDIEVTAELSEPIDEATVTSTSVTLEGPDGEVSGTLSVDRNVISFVPERPLYLLGTYTFTLADTIADHAGNTLTDSASAEFQIRDGRWSTPTYPFGRTVPRSVSAFQRNAHGDVVLGMTLVPTPETVYGAIYHAAETRWTPAGNLRTLTNAQHYVSSLGIDPERRAAVIWGISSMIDGGWSRFSEGEDWVNAGSLGEFASVAVTSTGLATAVWGRSPDFITRTQHLTDGTMESDVPYAMPDTALGPYLVASLDRIGILGTEAGTINHRLIMTWKEGTSWGTPRTLASAPEIGSLGFDSDEQGNIVVAWRENDQIWSRIYTRADDEWTGELLVATTTPYAGIGAIDITAGNAVLSFHNPAPDPSTWVAVYRAGVGWVQDSIVPIESASDDSSVAVTIDKRGYALAAWHSEFRFQRYVPGEGWQAPSSLEANLDPLYMWSAGAPDGTALVVANEVESATDQAPWAIRFE